MSSSPSKVYRFPVYQIDFSAEQAGKRVASSKRRIRWRFGFPNLQALDAGRTGAECRGEEHEVVAIWSIASGKRQVLMDGREIHYSANRVSILDHSWSTKGNHVLKIVCHAAPPMSAMPGFRQYDFLIDGQSFFTMPKMYELGIRSAGGRVPGRVEDYGGGGGGGDSYPTASRAVSYGGGGGGGGYTPNGYDAPAAVRAPRTPSEEEEELQRAINASLQESKQYLNKSNNPPQQQQQQQQAPQPEPPAVDLIAAMPATSDLLDFGGGGGGPHAIMPDSSASYGAPSSGYDNYGAPPPQQQQYHQQPSPYGGAQYGAPGQSQYETMPPAPNSSYLALPSSQPPNAQAPQYSSYGQPPPPQSQPGYSSSYAPGPPSYGGGAPPSYSSGLTVDPYSGHSSDDPFAPKPPTRSEIANDILKAYSSPTAAGSVAGGGGNGFDYQTGQPFSPQGNGYTNGGDGNNENDIKLSMQALTVTESKKAMTPLEQAMAKLVNFDNIAEPAEEKLQLTMKQKEEEKKKKDKKSAPLPPAAKGMVGSSASLAQISAVKPKMAPKDPVMKANLFSNDAAMSGTLVVHGHQFSTPPALQARGVGVVHMQGQQMGQQQMMMQQQQQQQQQMMMQQQQQQQQMMMQQQQQQQQQMMMQGGGGGYGQQQQQPPPQMQYQQQQWR